MRRIAGALYNGFLWACFITLLCVRSVVICMHVNMGVLFGISFFLMTLLIGIGSRILKMYPGIVFSFIELCGMSISLLCIYHFLYHQNLSGKPAFIVGLVLHDFKWTDETVNLMLAVILLVGLLFVAVVERLSEKNNS